MEIDREIKEDLMQCWSYAPQNERYAFERLLNHILDEPQSRLNHLTIGSFRRIINLNESDLNNEKLLKIALYLVNKPQLLEVGYELIEDDEAWPLEISDVTEARKTGWLAHPDDGHPVYNYQERVTLYFAQSQYLIKLKKGFR